MMTPHPSLSLRSNATFSRWRRLVRTVEILVDLRIILIRQTSSATFPYLGEGLTRAVSLLAAARTQISLSLRERWQTKSDGEG